MSDHLYTWSDEYLRDLGEPDTAAAPPPRFPGLSHAELLELEVPSASELVAGIVEAGTVGTIAGLPETYKSWVALELTLKIASGGAAVLARDVVQHGPVGYWWQDDSRENEVRRAQDYARRHKLVGDLPVRWHLNEGLVLPDGLDELRAEIERERQVLAVLDSLYNFLRGVKLKDEDVATIIAALKAEVCDPTGCAVAFVDHSPWPTEANHSRRGYGSVFKAAAIRWGIYLDREGDTVFVEARGNNLAGLARTAAVWNPDRLELRLVEAPKESGGLADRIADFLHRNPGSSTTSVQAAVKGNDREIRERLRDDDRFQTVPAILFGLPKNTKCWALAEEVADLLKDRG